MRWPKLAIILLNFISHLLCSSRANLGSTLQSGLFVAARRFLREERGEQTRFRHVTNLTSWQAAYPHAYICVMLAVVPSKARYKTSNDRNKHPRHRTARTTPTAIKSNQRRLGSRISDSRRLIELSCLRARASCSNRLADCINSAKNASPPHEKLKGCELFTVVEALMNLCTSCSSSGDSLLRLRKAVRPGLAGASRAAPQAAGVKPSFKHVKRKWAKKWFRNS